MTRFIFGLWLLIAPFAIFSQNEALRNPVVLINSGSETSAGIVTGREGSKLFILTVSHGLEDPGDIQVKFFTGEETSANVYQDNTNRDIAVITCNKPQGLAFPESFRIPTRDPNINDPVIVVGHPDEIGRSIGKKQLWL